MFHSVTKSSTKESEDSIPTGNANSYLKIHKKAFTEARNHNGNKNRRNLQFVVFTGNPFIHCSSKVHFYSKMLIYADFHENDELVSWRAGTITRLNSEKFPYFHFQA